MASFGNLYTYSTSNGVVVPQTTTIKSTIETAFKEIFGTSFCTIPSSTNGRLIEALTLMFIDTVGVSAQNANGMNITQAVGTFLDALGKNWNVVRLDGETDNAYRRRIIESCSRGSGFASSIRQAIGSVTGVKSVVVLDNGLEDPNVLPKDEYGNVTSNSIAVDAHSIFIAVRGGSDADIANAIKNTKSAGCGYTINSEYGIGSNAKSVTITDSDTNTSFTAKWYVPQQMYVKISVIVNGAAYTGSDIISDTKNAIVSLLNNYPTNATITKSQIIAAIASIGKNIVCSSCDIKVSASDPTLTTGELVESLVILPYKYVSTGDTDQEKIDFLNNNLSVVSI